MDPEVKKKALRMINYGMYVLTSKDGDQLDAATVNWVTHASFNPPLVVVGVKKDSDSFKLVKGGGNFALNVLAADQRDLAFAFFKHVEPEGNRIGPATFTINETSGAPVLAETPAWFACRVVDINETGDHAVVIGEVVDAGVNNPDAEPMFMRALNLFYGG